MKDNDKEAFTSGRPRTVIRTALGVLLVCAVLAEGYYIFRLRDIIGKQSDELRGTSLRLQSLKNAQAALQEELESIRKTAGDTKNGTTPQR